MLSLQPADGRFRIGTAGWANPPYERARRTQGLSHLMHYANSFDFVEINSSFYRSHQRATYERWREQTPVGFGFSVKLAGSVTHECGLRHCRSELRQFIAEVAGLGRKLRVILVQLPASLEFEARVASRFFRSMSELCSCGIACEPRHASWFTDAADALLRRHRVARVAADPAKAPGGDLPGGLRRLEYYRLHGSPRIYYSAYSPEFLTQLAKRLKAVSLRTTQVCCVFDNTAGYEAWSNALLLQSLLR
jgi:uncharacterized protein YecE (DUF72 family)